MNRLNASLLGLTLVLSPVAGWASCACGDDYCVGGERYETALKEKKSRLGRSGYTTELISLLDKADACYAAISMAPDGFSIMTVSADKTILVLEWTKDNARIASKQFASGSLSGYFVFNVRTAFACCGSARAEDRPDWDGDLSLNRGQAIDCTRNSGSACK